MDLTDSEKVAKTDAFAKKVLGTTELLESILLHIDDYQTLLFSQRVCRNFQDTIEQSTPLQHALFFKIHLDTHPAIPPILRDREIRIGKDGASVRLIYQPAMSLSVGCCSHRFSLTRSRAATRQPHAETGQNNSGATIATAVPAAPDLGSSGQITPRSYDEQNSASTSGPNEFPERSFWEGFFDDSSHSSNDIERGRAVELRLEVKRFPGGGQRSVEIGGTWQKVMLQNTQNSVFCNRRREYGPVSFSIPLSKGDTMGSLVDLALQFETDDTS